MCGGGEASEEHKKHNRENWKRGNAPPCWQHKKIRFELHTYVKRGCLQILDFFGATRVFL